MEQLENKSVTKPTRRCSQCDREVTHYNNFLAANNDATTVCWECLSREEKGFNAKRDFARTSRRGVIPR